MSEKLKYVVVWDGKYKRRLLEIQCKGCGKTLLIRKSRKHSGFCRSCGKSGENNPMHGKISPDRVKDSEKTFDFQTSTRKERKKKIILIMGNKCECCGVENLPMCCYTFHHIDPEDKCFSLSQVGENTFIKNWDMWLREIEKCALLCWHCHRIHHYGDERANG